MADLETIATIAGNLAIAMSFLVALVFGIAQTRGAARDRRERLTLETIRSFQTREFAAHLQYLRSHALPATAEALYALPVDEQVSFIHFAQEMEMLGLLVSDGTIELDLVERTLGSFVSYAWDKYRAMFANMRVANEDPYLAEYFEWLAKRIEDRMRDAPRAPAYA